MFGSLIRLALPSDHDLMAWVHKPIKTKMKRIDYKEECIFNRGLVEVTVYCFGNTGNLSFKIS